MKGKILMLFLIFALLSTLFAAAPAFPKELKVVTINVWSGLDYEGTLKMGEYESKEVRMGRYNLLVKELKRLDPDVIAINEANLLPRYARRLAKDLDMDKIHSVGLGGIHFGYIGIPVNFREGDAILAKKELKLKSLGRKRLSGGGIINNFMTFHLTDACQIIGGVINFDGRDVYIFNTHTHASPPNEPWFMERLEGARAEGRLTEEGLRIAKESVVEDQKWRMDEITKLLKWVSEVVPRGRPVVLVGDFNAEIDTVEMRQVIDAGFIDTHAVANPDSVSMGYTWNPETNLNIIKYYDAEAARTLSEADGASPKKIADKLDDFIQKRLDFIFVSESIGAENVIESAVVLDREEGGQHPSDHYGVMSVVNIE
ncbi:MAG: endonuclease/exonuclease/phosphatase family protein [Deltaproteobacteria bacterium]|uniref:Endonuclease/exonuclease/phosphatase family protein n=1 Tax=Candidatus Zymogenus saltonus TaxID=2844893 RepID=A0A9D8KG30_9DELT|nr:endonuclease/exonuclease/phosphatase family protein [Candidatus Zymogenus saltonus]